MVSGFLPLSKRSQGGVAAGLRRQTGARGPEHPARPHLVEIDLLGGDGHVGCGRLAVEEKREVVRWEQLAEDHRGAQRGVGSHEAVVDAEPSQGPAHVIPKPSAPTLVITAARYP